MAQIDGTGTSHQRAAGLPLIGTTAHAICGMSVWFELGDNGPMWVIAARLSDGRRVYFNAAGERQGQSEWSPRINQAQSFDTEDGAAKVAATFEANTSAKDYEVMRVAPK